MSKYGRKKYIFFAKFHNTNVLDSNVLLKQGKCTHSNDIKVVLILQFVEDFPHLRCNRNFSFWCDFINERLNETKEIVQICIERLMEDEMGFEQHVNSLYYAE